ncbi:MAG: hypothetical protein OEX00_02230 [Gammaproteobacteria bacterium]|nr:hypothetical protein [Gammaproteobacteria bacterium]MDH5692013.1 hypothetical protein [Gammaproteobacteria bacterium]
MIIADTHVHFYPVFDMASLLNSAFDNLSRIAAKQNQKTEDTHLVLMLTESSRQDWFVDTYQQLNKGQAVEYGQWSIQRVADDTRALDALSPNSKKIKIIQGYQIVTKENLEVLGLCSKARIADGASLDQTINSLLEQDAMPVLPWGVGKWLGTRGELVSARITASTVGTVALGDNGGRPGLFPYPRQFSIAKELGMAVYPGTDPLPIRGEEKRVGTCVSYIPQVATTGPLSAQIVHALKQNSSESNGHHELEGLFRFFRNQALLRLNK